MPQSKEGKYIDTGMMTEVVGERGGGVGGVW